MLKRQQTPTSDLLVIPAQDLVVGMYVDLNCSWFKHPFPRRAFKIASQSQLLTIRSLDLPNVLVDPQQSDPETFAGTTNTKDIPTATPEAIATQETETAEALPAAADFCENVHLAGKTYQQMLKRGGQIMKEVCAGSEEGLSSAKIMVNALSTLIMNSSDASTIASLFTTQEVDNVSVLHALNVSTLSMIIGRQLQMSHDELRIIGMAGLLHDIGEQNIPIKILRNKDHLSKSELREYQRHPEYTIDMLRRFPQFPDDILDIIRCHHERQDGSGYPAKLTGAHLSGAARIVMVVDEYDSLSNNSSHSTSLTPSEALAQVYAKAKSTFPEEITVALIQTLSVYPPGSIVELSDGRVGLVISLNVESRMRPMILLYDPATSRENPHIVNLAKDPARSIARSVPKQQLSPAITDYLNLHRWTGYFIESSLKALKDPAAP